ncbi:hypothetical protein B0H11DRAFT_2242058 [Mycena galericulata]|nr:hypothetical protein B0H11DRAFT_2242058 [Mycena galericulata]
MPGDLTKSLRALRGTLEETRDSASKHLSDNVFKRFTRAKMDKSKVDKYRQRMAQGPPYLTYLKTLAGIQTDVHKIKTNVDKIVETEMDKGARQEHLPSVPAAVQNMLPEHANSILPVLGVCIAFKQAPSVLQISRVLAIDANQVTGQLGYISLYLGSHFDPANSLTDVELPGDLEQWLVSPEHAGALWIHVSRYHSRVAQWCLVGKRTYDVRDVLYKANNWAFHVCRSDVSEELYKALADSELPSQSTSQSHAKLQFVINWLKSQRHPSQELISTFEALLGKHPSR